MVLASVAGSAAGSVLLTLDPLLFKRLVDKGLPSHNTRGIIALIVGIAACQVLRTLAFGIANIFNSRLAAKVAGRLKAELLTHISYLPTRSYEACTTGELATVLDHDVVQISRTGTDICTVTLRTVAIVGFCLYMMARLSSGCTLVVLAAIPLYILLQHVFRTALTSKADSLRARMGAFSDNIFDFIGALQELRLLNAHRYYSNRLVNMWDQVATEQVKIKQVEASYNTSVSLVMATVTAIVLVAASMGVISSRITVGTLLALYAYSSRIFEPLAWTSDLFIRSTSVLPSIERVQNILNRAVEERHHGRVNAKTTVNEFHFELFQVIVEAKGRRILDIPHLILHGERDVAIVGASGAGKSTLVRLLCGIDAPNHGSLTLDGVDMRNYTRESLWQTISLVHHQTRFLKGTWRDFITHGRTDMTDCTIMNAIEIVQLDSLFRLLPDGLDTPVTSLAHTLSAGERQRLAIARAITRGPRVLILDEATAALDSATESALFADLAQRLPNMKLVVITHRIRSIAWINRVILLKSGSVYGIGSPSALYESSDIYRELYNSTAPLDTPENIGTR